MHDNAFQWPNNNVHVHITLHRRTICFICLYSIRTDMKTYYSVFIPSKVVFFFKWAIQNIQVFVFHKETKNRTQPPSLPLSGSPFWLVVQAFKILFNEVPKSSWSCFLSAQIHSDIRDMLGFISGRPGLCGTSTGITTCLPAKIFTRQLQWIHRKGN